MRFQIENTFSYTEFSFKQALTSHTTTSQLAFATIPMSLVRTFSMMLGEMDFVGTYVEPYSYHELPLPISSFALLSECQIQSNRFHANNFIDLSPSLNNRFIHDSHADSIDESVDRFGRWWHWIGAKECSTKEIGNAGCPAHRIGAQVTANVAWKSG